MHTPVSIVRAFVVYDANPTRLPTLASSHTHTQSETPELNRFVGVGLGEGTFDFYLSWANPQSELAKVGGLLGKHNHTKPTCRVYEYRYTKYSICTCKVAPSQLTRGGALGSIRSWMCSRFPLTPFQCLTCANSGFAPFPFFPCLSLSLRPVKSTLIPLPECPFIDWTWRFV